MLNESAVRIGALELPGADGHDVAQWQLLHERLKEYSRMRSALDAAEAFELVLTERFKLYAVFGCATHYEYLEREMGWKPHAARERMRVARALQQLPLTTAELSRGERTYSAVRELSRVVIADTEEAWLARTKGMSTAEIEQLVAGRRPGDLPDDPVEPDLRPKRIAFEWPTFVVALWREARKVLAVERNGEVSDAELAEALCRRLLEPGTGVDGPAHQIAYKQCPDCKRATQNGAGREIDVAPAVVERAACDAVDIGSLDASRPARKTTTVTPRMRQQIFARDNFRCTVPGCRSARNLEVHHIHERAKGGSHEPENLTLLCSGHHVALHDGRLSMKGTAPYSIQFRWTYGEPIPPGLSREARDELIRKRLHFALGGTEESFAPTIEDLIDDERRERRQHRSRERAEALADPNPLAWLERWRKRVGTRVE